MQHKSYCYIIFQAHKNGGSEGEEEAEQGTKGKQTTRPFQPKTKTELKLVYDPTRAIQIRPS